MSSRIRRVDVDVVVVGGGIGGSSAALTAQNHGLSVALLVKGFLGRSGCSVLAAYMNKPGAANAGQTGVSVEQERELLVRHHQHYLLDATYALAAAAFIRDRFFNEIEELGLYLLRHSDGGLVSNQEPISQVVAHKYGHTARLVSDLLRKHVLSRQAIDVFEETSVTDLLQDHHGRCIGVVAYNYRTDEYVVVRAGTTILATGHTNYLATRSTGTREMTGNGFAMSYRAGADIQNLEMQLWHIGDINSPPSWMRFHNYPNPLLETHERVVNRNGAGEIFFSGNDYPVVTAPYYLQMRELSHQVKAGNARWDGGYYADYRHIPQDVLDRYHTMPEVFAKLGLDLGRDLVECAATWHMTAGGLRIDPDTMSTTVPGLLTAGSVGGHYLGDIPHCYYDGVVAGSHAAKKRQDRASEDLVETAAGTAIARIERLRAARCDTALTPAQVKRAIREVVAEHLGYVKTRASLSRAIEELERLRVETVPRMEVKSRPGGWNYQVVDALDVSDMLDVTWLSARYSLFREESRGPFYRADFPAVDHEKWLCDVVGRREDDELVLRKEPIRTPLGTPSTPREDYFEYR